MAKNLLLVSLLLYITIAEAAPIAVEWSATASKSINAMKLKLGKALDEVVLAAPPPKRKEVEKATTGHFITIDALLAKARARGDEKKAISIASSYEKAADIVIAAPPAQKFDAMETTFSIAATPDPTKCPKVDKAFCETYSKTKKAQEEVISAAPPAKAAEIKDAVIAQGFAMGKAISRAYTTGDEKKIATILADYNNAADAVIASAPAQKYEVMEGTFTGAAHASEA
ncbi:hypothetical protein BS78_05G220200 [Paspalum vaginatum]|uniref:Uncharacterized protein n=1 Tax=Paspalum vaginatum TaxID=158149 RepID=A0A9W8CFJ4_9POAL|nr:hypothetical protein BS78_K159800 [Paspalum vaginatum]KAJ1255790.1 hypothetical protein BS78_K159900 [Paspalum vaginatum]KAJ1255791.1 hypothetical protein BS78_K160000 [Paspalum vaginatum]KAJ1255792.1 hypothetical protein BS78_K160100 [Paspalum vaginatum]KAJ1255793.1 hypothetical protein BS78_K160200 [Paspalum vaginatum]